MNYGIPEPTPAPVMHPDVRNKGRAEAGLPEHNAPDWIRITCQYKEPCGNAGSAVLKGVAAICPEGYVSLQSARAQFGAGDSIYNAVKAGRLPCQRIGRYVFVRPEDVEHYLERRKA